VNHLLRVGPTQNGSGLFVVETVSVENGADRPFAGNVSFAVPSDAEVVTAMVNNERTAVSRTNDTAAVETMISPQEPTTVDVFYRLEDQTFEKPVGYDVEQLAIQFAEHDLSQVEVSDNLVEADAPMPMVTSTGPLEADDRISVSITESNQTVASDQTDDGSGPASSPARPREPRLRRHHRDRTGRVSVPVSRFAIGEEPATYSQRLISVGAIPLNYCQHINTIIEYSRWTLLYIILLLSSIAY